MAALAAKAAALSATRRSRRRRTTIGAGSPACSAASCPHAAPISVPRLIRIVVSMPAARSRPANRSMTGIGVPDHGVWATWFIGIGLTCAWSPRRRSAKRVGVGVGVVDAVDHRHLVGHPPAGRRGVLARGGDDLLHRPAAVQRHQDVPQRVPRRVDAHRERELRTERRQAADPGHHPRGGHRDVPRAEAEPGVGR